MELADLRFLYDLSIYNCQHYGTYTSLFYEDTQQDLVREYTNVEIVRESTQLAAGLRALGIEKGDRVIVMMLNCPEVITAYQAIARAGAIIIPVLPLLKGPEVRYIAENSAAKVVITDANLLPLLRTALADVATMQHIISTGTQEADTSALGTINRPLHLHTYRDIVAKGAPEADDYLEDLAGVSLSPDDTAVTLYTSGTTGRPKGVVLTHRNIVSNALSGRRGDAAVTRFGEVQLAILPLAHGYGLLVSNVAYLSGATIVMHSRFDTTAVLSAIERYRISGFAGVPAMFVALLYTPDTDKYDTSSLQNCVCGSAPLPVAILEGFEQKFGCP